MFGESFYNVAFWAWLDPLQSHLYCTLTGMTRLQGESLPGTVSTSINTPARPGISNSQLPHSSLPPSSAGLVSNYCHQLNNDQGVWCFTGKEAALGEKRCDDAVLWCQIARRLLLQFLLLCLTEWKGVSGGLISLLDV
jgi:hypothetical protein